MPDIPSGILRPATKPTLTFYGTYPHTAKAEGILSHGLYIDLTIMHEISPEWAFGLGTGHYRIDTTEISPPYPSYPPLEGVPVLIKAQYGHYSRTGLLRYYFTVAGGHMFYAENDVVDNEAVALSSLGIELFGKQHLDFHFEFGHFWAFDSHYDQWTAGAGMAYNF